MRVLSLLLLCFTTATAAAAVPFTPASRYHVVATMSLPKGNIMEPIEAWYDANANRQRMEYYAGMDTYIFRADMGVTWQMNPTTAITTSCFETKATTDAPLTIQPLFPLLTSFTYTTNTTLNGVPCQQWTYTHDVDGRKNVYDFYVDTTNGIPLRYHMFGYDSLLGSHFDEYVLDYLNYTTDSFPDTVFDHPTMTCGGFPGPGFMISNPLLAIASAFPSTPITHIDHLTPEYRTFLTTHDKSYATLSELIYRQSIYTSNHRWKDAHNRRVKREGKGAMMKMNGMGDWTSKEMNRRRGIPDTPRQRPENNGATHIHIMSGQAIPDAIDWRDKGAVNKVKDQGICGSCWSFATTGTLEGSYFIKTGQLIQLSEQELMDCSWSYGNNACDGGEDFRGYQWIIGSQGLADTSYGPYLMADGFCHALNDTINYPVQLSGYVNITSGSEAALMDAIATKGPISISIDASQQSLSFYSSGVYYEPACKNDVAHLDHSVLAVGYGTSETGETYWIVKNSWSDLWGDNGYVKMSRKDNNCGVMTAPTYGILL